MSTALFYPEAPVHGLAQQAPTDNRGMNSLPNEKEREWEGQDLPRPVRNSSELVAHDGSIVKFGVHQPGVVGNPQSGGTFSQLCGQH